jgi:ABC transporter substrate binding protein (PQQ-dependent alcohol dehydrogenase system)
LHGVLVWSLWRAAVAVVLAVSSFFSAPVLAATKVTVAVVSLADDARYAPRRMERGYPGQPTGRAIDGANLGADDSAFELDAAGITLAVLEVVLPNAAALPKALAALKAAKVQHVIADLPLTELRQLVQAAPAALGGAMVFNTALDDDSLRAKGCAAALLHTYPSRLMMSDALAQYLAARNWRKALVLQGPLPGDALQGKAWARSAKRYGIKTTQERPFKLSGDPRERDLANTRLLTGDRDHDVVAVMDSDGEFARSMPYATQWPRPVVGANGLMALAWHPQWERYGGPQLTRRFFKLAHRPMRGQDWAAWMAVRSVATVLVDNPKATVPQQLKALRGGAVFVDGFKGTRLSFRAWDGQLRQPVFLSHVDGVVGSAPVEGVLHPVEVLDTLGVDQKESTCKAQP